MLELIDRRLSIDLGTGSFGGVNLKFGLQALNRTWKATKILGSPVQIKTLSWNLHV